VGSRARQTGTEKSRRKLCGSSGVIWILILGCVQAAHAQSKIQLEFGIRAGVPFAVSLEETLTGAAAGVSSVAFERSNYSVGPTVSAVIRDRVVLSFDSLYKPIHFTSSFFGGSPSISRVQGSSWEFPLIADYRFLNRQLRPYGGGGVLVAQKLSGTRETRTTDFRTGSVSTRTSEFRSFWDQLPAYVINGGVEWRMSHWVIRPELRYTHWSSVHQPEQAVRRQNQFEFLIGFSSSTAAGRRQ
jgi:hypothetical protein